MQIPLQGVRKKKKAGLYLCIAWGNSSRDNPKAHRKGESRSNRLCFEYLLSNVGLCFGMGISRNLRVSREKVPTRVM